MAADARVLAMLPGSRGGEVAMLGPLFLETAALLMQKNPDLKLVIPAANAARLAQLRDMVASSGLTGVELVDGRSREVMLAADVVLMASGTATLEVDQQPLRVRLSGFCRNCLADWIRDAGYDGDKAAAREVIHGMPMDDWKATRQKPATTPTA